MEGKARILLYGFSAEEVGWITAALGEVGVPAPGVLRPTQGHVQLSEIILNDRDGTKGFSCPERLVLFHNLSEAGIGTLVRYIRGLDVPRAIFAVVTEASFRWTLAELLEHLVEERQALEGGAAGQHAGETAERAAAAPHGKAGGTAERAGGSAPANQSSPGEAGPSPES